MSDEAGDDGMATEERFLLAERDTARLEVTRLKAALERLVRRYVKNPSTYSQFIACITTDSSSLPEWDAAMELLGMKLAPGSKTKLYSREGKKR